MVAESKHSEQSRALCRSDIEGLVFVAEHPNDSVREAAETCDVVLVDVDDAVVDRFAADSCAYRPTTFPGGPYRVIDAEICTFGVRTTLVSTARVSADVIYAVVNMVARRSRGDQVAASDVGDAAAAGKGQRRPDCAANLKARCGT